MLKTKMQEEAKKMKEVVIKIMVGYYFLHFGDVMLSKTTILSSCSKK